MRLPIIKVEIAEEFDVVLARQRAKQLTEQFGMDVSEQTRFATAVSELARNAFVYAGGGKAEFAYEDNERVLSVTISDRGRGIPHLQSILDGQYVSATGMGVGLAGAKRLSDTFDIQSTERGTIVTVGKRLQGAKSITGEQLSQLSAALLQQPVDASAMYDARRRNAELVQTLEALRERQTEIERLNRELEETNRGVLALYAELDEKALSLKQASELKSRFLSQMSHELRTPLNSIIMLSRLMQSGLDGELSMEHKRQVDFIQSAGEGLLELVNDLLDLAKIESGRVDVVPREVSLNTVWAALRGMFRPLIVDLPIELLLGDVAEMPMLMTDEGKISQVLRNLVSNAVKFTKHGTVRVSAELADNDQVLFQVSDTGIGIPQEHQAVLFTEFVQLAEAAGYQQKGTGLGLALCRRLVEMLGGKIWCSSERGEGATFSFLIPRIHVETRTLQEAERLSALL